MSRLRLNQDLRNKISSRWRVHAEQEETDEKEKYFQARETVKPLQDKTWQLASTMVRKHYTPEDIKMAYHLQNKFDNVNTIAKDSCFHFGYMAKKMAMKEWVLAMSMKIVIVTKMINTSQNILIFV